jgi:hypothetical protein
VVDVLDELVDEVLLELLVVLLPLRQLASNRIPSIATARGAAPPLTRRIKDHPSICFGEWRESPK